MKLPYQSAMAIGAGALVVLGLDLAWTVAREREAFEREKHADHLQLLRVLVTARALEPDAGVEVLRRRLGEQPAGALRVRVVPAGADIDDERHLVSRLALGEAAELVAIEEDTSERGFLWGSIAQRAGTVLVMVAVMAVLAWRVSARVVARRVDQLVQHLRQVGAGRAPPPLAVAGADELSVLAAEANAMTNQLHSTRQALERAHDERVRAMEQLRHADRLVTVGRLAAGLAHELGAPLSVISIKADKLREGPHDEGARGHATVIRDRVEFIRSLVRRVLRFGRPLPPQRRQVDLVELSRETISMMAPLAAKHGVDVRLRASGPVHAFIDPHQLEQVLTNLLGNAFLASSRGQAVEVALSREDAGVTVAVRDEGVGMSAETRAHLFEPFFTTRGVSEGTGLGLSVCWGIVRDHGGHIDVITAPGLGTTFTVVLPQPQEAAHEPTTDSAAPAAPAPG